MSPDQVREETPLAPLLLETKVLTTDVLAARLGKPVSTTTLEKRMDRHLGFVRHSLLRAEAFPLYLAVTVIVRRPETQALIRDLRQKQVPLLGAVLKKHGLYGRKTSPSIQRTPLLPKYRELLGLDPDVAETWERTYAILSPANWKVAGVTEIFSPKLEEFLRTTAGPAGRR